MWGSKTSPSGVGYHQPGFTMIEILMVLVIIMILVTLALPDVLRGTTNQPLVEGTHKVMDIIHYAKNRAIHDFSAYGLEISPASGQQPGRLEVFQGSGPQCGSIDTVGTDPVRTYDLDDLFPVSQQDPPLVQVRIQRVDPQALDVLCFTPDGRAVDRDTSQPVASTLSGDYAAGEAVIVLQKTIGGSPASQEHNVLVPFSGKPRFTFGNEGDIDRSAGEGGA